MRADPPGQIRAVNTSAGRRPRSVARFIGPLINQDLSPPLTESREDPLRIFA